MPHARKSPFEAIEREIFALSQADDVLAEIYRDFYQKAVDLDDPNPETNPHVRPEVLDAPLTEKGRQACASKRGEASLLNPQAILVSPLHRALQTASISFADFYTGQQQQDIPWIACEGAREQMGLLLCNKRRSLLQTRDEFPHVDFSYIPSDEQDEQNWDSTARESPRAETDRIYNFLTEFLMERPEDELALVGHSAWLFTMCNAVLDCQEDSSLTKLFATSEIRSMRLKFRETTPEQ